MSYEDAQQVAINAGALRPQGFAEKLAENWEKYQNPYFRWEQTARAQGRLTAWANAIIEGVSPHNLREVIG